MPNSGEQTRQSSGETRRPVVVLLGGPNGAGKTTAAITLLAQTLRLVNYVNADIIAQGLSGFAPADAAWDAGRILLSRVDELAAQRADFAVESTLAGRVYSQRLRNWSALGYETNLYYFWLNSVELAINRVAARVQQGGHSIPEPVVRNRYGQSVKNCVELFLPQVDYWQLLDNSEGGPCVVFGQGGRARKTQILDTARWEAFQREAST